MPWNGIDPAVPGEVIAAAFWNEQLGENILEVRQGGIAVPSQAAGNLLVAQSDSQLERLVGTSKTANMEDATLQRPHFKDYSEAVADVSISAGTLTLNLEAAPLFRVTLNANVTTLTISNPPATGRHGSFILELTADGTPRTISWPASVKWPNATAPTLTSTNGKKDRFHFSTTDAGTTYAATNLGQNR